MSDFVVWAVVGVWFVLTLAMWGWIYEWPTKFNNWLRRPKCEVCRKRVEQVYKFHGYVLWHCLPCASEEHKETDNA